MMKLTELLRNIEVLEIRAPEDMEIADVCYDSRSVSPGAAFIAAAPSSFTLLVSPLKNLPRMFLTSNENAER